MRGRNDASELSGEFSAPAAFITSGATVNLIVKASLETSPVASVGAEFTIKLYDAGAFPPQNLSAPWDFFTQNNVPSLTVTVTLDADDPSVTTDLTDLTGRTFLINVGSIDTGFYDITVEADHTLVNLRDNVGIHVGLAGAVPMGTLLEGNAVDDPRGAIEPATIVNALDASVLAAAISEFRPDPRADFNPDGANGDADKDLLTKNYLLCSPRLQDPPAGAPVTCATAPPGG